MGFNVHASTGKLDARSKLESLGATKVFGRAKKGQTKPLSTAIWDGVIDTVGGDTLAKALSECKFWFNALLLLIA